MNKIISIILVGVVLISFNGCGKVVVENPYSLYEDSYTYGLTSNAPVSSTNLMAQSLCVTDGSDLGVDEVDSQVCEGAGLFNIDSGEILYSQNLLGKLYPASTTKMLTAYVAVKYGDLEQEITVSEYACDQASDSSICNLNPGDVLTLRQLLYGLMLRSGNDAAIAIAEGVSGDVESFVDLMNEEAKKLGATHSHFVTPNGLHDEDHYTTIYDMYLISNAAISYNEVTEILQTVNYDVYYKNSAGEEQQQSWSNTCGYLSGSYSAPDGITVIGGKTGTTNPAGYCLVAYCTNEENEHMISIVYHADCRGNLYLLMNEILNQFGR
ncbi:MAG: D-alanyl-D-alanine carboxypeptidase [Lachnospiraceae bacterium]|nr:D-alanyl-D-alanine carboxypeptidase [Lachnospiraceae bacterium]